MLDWLELTKHITDYELTPPNYILVTINKCNKTAGAGKLVFKTQKNTLLIPKACINAQKKFDCPALVGHHCKDNK